MSGRPELYDLTRPDKLPEQFVSWLRRLIAYNGQASSGGTIKTVTSADASITVTAPHGPTVDLSVASIAPRTVQVSIPLSTPDSSGYAFPSLTTSQVTTPYSNVRRLEPYCAAGNDSSWQGEIVVPQNYSSTPKIIILFTSEATSGNVRWFVSTSFEAAAANADPAWTDETAQNVATAGTANYRTDATFTLSTTPVAGKLMNVKVTRQGSSGSDTCTKNAAIVGCVFQYLGT